MWANVRALWGLVSAIKSMIEAFKKWRYNSEKEKGEQVVDNVTKNEQDVQVDKEKPIEDNSDQTIKDAVDNINGVKPGNTAPTFPKPTNTEQGS